MKKVFKNELMRRKINATKHCGFSLIELVIVIAVLGIIAVLAFPSYRQVLHDAKVATGKDLLSKIISECMVVYLRNGSATAGDLAMTAYGANNAPGGTRLGIQFGEGQGDHPVFGGYVLDTDLNSQIPLRPQHSCFQVAAKSGTTHFMIKYDIETGKLDRDCRIDAGETMYKPYHCDPSKPAGKHW